MYPGADRKPWDIRSSPIPAPEAGIFDAPNVVICLNVHWVGHLDGVLERLLYPDAWQGTDEQKQAAIQEVGKLVAKLGEIRDCLVSGEIGISPTDQHPGYLTEKLMAGKNITLTLVGQGGNEQLLISAPNVPKKVQHEITPVTPHTLLLVTLPAGTTVLEAMIVIDQPFDGELQVAVGFPGNSTAFIDQTDVEPTSANAYGTHPNYLCPEDTPVYLSLSMSNVTSGSGRAILIIQE